MSEHSDTPKLLVRKIQLHLRKQWAILAIQPIHPSFRRFRRHSIDFNVLHMYNSP
jgi:hypothetical protein